MVSFYIFSSMCLWKNFSQPQKLFEKWKAKRKKKNFVGKGKCSFNGSEKAIKNYLIKNNFSSFEVFVE